MPPEWKAITQPFPFFSNTSPHFLMLKWRTEERTSYRLGCGGYQKSLIYLAGCNASDCVFCVAGSCLIQVHVGQYQASNLQDRKFSTDQLLSPETYELFWILFLSNMIWIFLIIDKCVFFLVAVLGRVYTMLGMVLGSATWKPGALIVCLD